MAEATKSPSKAATYSVRREVGVMAAFIAIFIISLVAFGVASRIANARSYRRERDRLEELARKGYGATEYTSAEK